MTAIPVFGVWAWIQITMMSMMIPVHGETINRITMKHLLKPLSLAAFATIALFSCTKEPEPTPEQTGTQIGNATLVFSTSVANPETKATLTPNDADTQFSANWETGNTLSLTASSGTYSQTHTAVWNDEEAQDAFTAKGFTDVPGTGDWTYKAVWPVPTESAIDFGSSRVQNGDAYNSNYDVMSGSLSCSGAEFGKDASGKSLVVPMNRLTGIAYFHITSDVDEEVVSATLEATGISAETVVVDENGELVVPEEKLNSITLTFEDNVPNAQDFKLWFNVLPGEYSGMTLTITTTSKTTVLTSNTTITYTAGKLNKAVLSNLTWTEKPQNIYNKVTTVPYSWSGTYLIVFEGATVNGSSVPPVAFNGALGTLDATSNGTSVTISENQIIGKSAIDAAVFEISAFENGYSIRAVGNTGYIGQTSNANGLMVGETAYANTITLDEDGNANIVSGGAYLRYNASSDQTRFRYFKSSSYTSQKPVALYLLEGSGAVDPRSDVTLAFSPAEPEAISLGDEFTEPTLTKTPSETPVTYSVATEPSGIATINAETGVLDITGVGTITVTASVSDETTYKPASASYTLTVNVPAGQGTTVDNPYSVAEAIVEIKKLESNTNSASEVYISGIVSQVDSYNSTHNSITYNISDNGSTTGQLKVYGGLAQEGSEFSSKDDLSVGDQVVIKGYLYYYNGTTPEINSNSRIVTIIPAPKYTITLVQPSNGTITASVSQAVAGTTITLTATPNSGYILDAWDVKDSDNIAVAVSNNSFEMPAKNVTVTASFVAGADYVTLPWSYPGEGSATSAGITAITGVTASGLGSDYAVGNAPYQIKFDTTGDYIQVKTGSAIGQVSVGYKMLGGADTSALTFKESADGTNWSEVQMLSISGTQNSTGVLTTTDSFDAESRYVQIYFTKGSNVGIGSISITEAGSTPIVPTYAVTWTAPSTSVGTIVATVNGSDITSGDEFAEGTVVTITATPATGYLFGGWTVNGANAVDATSATTTITVGTQSVSFSAKFNSTEGNTSTLTFTKACGGSGTADDGVAWTVTSDGTESTFDSDRGIHYGTNSAAVQYIKLTTSGISGTITKVVVNASAASTATASVTVGGSAFGGDAQSLTSSAANYTFNGSASGEIIVTVTKPSSAKKALYVKSVVVTYTPSN